MSADIHTQYIVRFSGSCFAFIIHEFYLFVNNLRRILMPVLFGIISIVLLIPILMLILSYFFYRLAVKRDAPKIPDEFIIQVKEGRDGFIEKLSGGKSWFCSQNYKTVFIQSHDGLKLAGYLLPRENAQRTVICFHGYRGDSIRDFGCITRFYHENGSNLLLVDQRGHGNSEGEYICYGIKERYDCLRWTEYIQHLYGSSLPIYLNGLSMGCSTVLMACGLNLPLNVHGVIADCGFTSPWDIFYYLIRRKFRLPAFPFLQIADFICRRRAGFGFKDLSTLDVMAIMKVPVLFFHGGNDFFVPANMSRRNHEACVSEKHIEIIEGAGHGLSYMTATERYQNAILDLFKKHH